MSQGERICQRMCLLLRFLCCLLILCSHGCLIVPVPQGNKLTAGYEYPKEGLAFLNLPDTTREEVVATLGPPTFESGSAKTLLYVWEKTSKWELNYYMLSYPTCVPLGNEPVNGKQRLWGLFVAYDEKGLVSRHEIRTINPSSTLEAACLAWNSPKSPER
jgi:hypothetical protein